MRNVSGHGALLSRIDARICLARMRRLTLRLMHSSCTILSISSVVMPGLIAAAAMSRTSLASRQTLRIASWPFLSKSSTLFLLIKRAELGMPVTE